MRIHSRHWVKQYNCYCLSEKNIIACSCLWLDGQFNWSRVYRKQFQLKSFDFVFVNFNTKFSENANFLFTRSSFISPVSQTEVGIRNRYFSVRGNMKRYKLREFKIKMEKNVKFENRWCIFGLKNVFYRKGCTFSCCLKHYLVQSTENLELKPSIWHFWSRSFCTR